MKTKNIFIILGIVLIVSVIILSALSLNLLSIFSTHEIKPTVNSMNRIVDNSDFAVYEFRFVDANPESPSCKEFPGQEYSVSGIIDVYPSGQHFSVDGGNTFMSLNYDLSDLSRDVKPELVSLDMSNFNIDTYDSCGGIHRGLATISNEKVECVIVSDSNINCVLSFDVSTPDRTSGNVGDMSGNFRIKLLKKGIECIEDIHCNEGEECINNICQEWICNEWDRKCDNDTIMVCKNNEWVFEKTCTYLQECKEGICILREIVEPPTPERPLVIEWFVNTWNSIVDWFRGLFG